MYYCQVGFEDLSDEEGRIVEAATAFEAVFVAGDGDGAFYLGRMMEMGVAPQALRVRCLQ